MKLLPAKPGRRTVSRLASLAPLFSLAMLLVYPWTLAVGKIDADALRARHVHVKAAIEEVPEKLGRWLKTEDIEIPTGALKILNPNAYISRVYQRLGKGESVFATVMVVHCSDVRDMSSHYPPICYPRSGWYLIDDATSDWSIQHGNNRRINGRTYSFRRLGKNGVDSFITVSDTFLLPGKKSTRDMSDLLHVASRYRNSIEGVAQVQIFFKGDYRSPERRVLIQQMVGEILEALPENLFNVLDGNSDLLEFELDEGAES